MASTLSELGLEQLTKSSEWQSLIKQLSLNKHGNTLPYPQDPDIRNSILQFGIELEFWVKENMDTYRITIAELKSEMLFMQTEYKQLLRENQEQAISLRELVTENSKLHAEFKNILNTLAVKKLPHEEMAELQDRIMQLYELKEKN